MIEKTPSIAAPFRRQLFEPYDQIIYNPIGHITLHPQRKTNIPHGPTPITDERGDQYYRLSDIKEMIRKEIIKKEEEIRQEFVKNLNKEIVNTIQRREQSESNNPSNPKSGNSSSKDPVSPNDSNHDSTENDDAKNLYF